MSNVFGALMLPVSRRGLNHGARYQTAGRGRECLRTPASPDPRILYRTGGGRPPQFPR